MRIREMADPERMKKLLLMEMADPDWMYHQPAPDPWEQTLNKWENRKVEAYEQKDNDGAVFPVKEGSKTEEWHADFTGTAMIDGKEYYVGITNKTSKAGNPYKKLKFKLKQEQFTSPAREPEKREEYDW